MAIYHCTVKTIGRASGRSAVAAAAYRSGTRLVDERQQLVHDFGRKRGVVASGIELPESAPDRWRDRSALWNEVERTERSSRAQTAREIEAALPRGLSRAEQVELVRDYADGLTARGMVVDWSIHDVDGRNPHVHMLMPQRSCDADGFLAKSRTAYVCERDGERRSLTADELREQPGWEKVYLYDRREMTMPQAEAVGLDPKADRDRRQPLQETRYLNDWNEPERVPEWRREWEDCQNRALERYYERTRVPEAQRSYTDCRSYAEQGVELEPTRHEGPVVSAIETIARAEAAKRRAAYEPVTERHRENLEIRQRNGELAALKRELEQVRERIRQATERLRELRDRARERVREMAQRASLQRAREEEPKPEQAQCREMAARQPDRQPEHARDPLEVLRERAAERARAEGPGRARDPLEVLRERAAERARAEGPGRARDPLEVLRERAAERARANEQDQRREHGHDRGHDRDYEPEYDRDYEPDYEPEYDRGPRLGLY